MRKILKRLTLLLALSLTSMIAGCANTLSEGNETKAADYNAQLGVGYMQKERLDLAKEYLEKSLRANPNTVDSNHYYALLQERLGDERKATHYFNRAVRFSGNKPSSELMNNYGSHLCKTGQYTKAVQAFKIALRDPLYSTPEFAYTNIGVCLSKQGNTTEALRYFREALAANNDFPLALYHLARLSYEQKDYSKAQAYWYRFNEHSQQTAESLLLCAQINNVLGDQAQTKQCATQLLAHFPNSAEAKQIN